MPLHVVRRAGESAEQAVGEGGARAILDDAQELGVALQRRVQLPVAITAVVCMVAGLGTTAATLFFDLPINSDVVGVRQVAFLVMVCGCWLSVAALLPTDRHLPRVILVFGLVLLIVLAVNDVLTTVQLISRLPTEGSSFASPLEQCFATISGKRVFDVSCRVRPRARVARAVIHAFVGLCGAAVFASLLVARARPRTCRIYVRVVTRIAILAYTLTDGGKRIVEIAVYEAFLAEAGGVPPTAGERRNPHINQGPLVRVAIQLLICIFALSPAGIRRFQAFLARRGSTLIFASAVSAIINGRRAEDVHSHAIATFRGVRADLLRREHFESFAPAPELFALSQPMPIGEVDAFVSHSWADRADEKFAGLVQWRAHFRDKHGGREPLLWLDRACFSQIGMDSNLAALPVYIMGCQSLLCIAGPTYASRLWCLFECFMFLAGGGDQVTTITLPAVEAQLQQGRDVWGSVMLSRAQCIRHDGIGRRRPRRVRSAAPADAARLGPRLDCRHERTWSRCLRLCSFAQASAAGRTLEGTRSRCRSGCPSGARFARRRLS
jgi:hypothetical protein